ncbi:MAG: septum formation initiator family protein [Dysgonamonadaceae bacterium]|jgi:cell division protein FtsB|nr:septum formation initiator family protein [Dysgonamonadaceae bacterium]
MEEIFSFFKSTAAKFQLNKYSITVVVFVVLFLLAGESRLDKRIGYDLKINELEKKIDESRLRQAESQRQLDALQSDNETLEKLAREQYKMLKSDEELFLIK